MEVQARIYCCESRESGANAKRLRIRPALPAAPSSETKSVLKCHLLFYRYRYSIYSLS